MPCGRRMAARSLGFTLIELITTLVILGVLSVYAISRFFDRSTFDTRAYYDIAQGMLRYGQKLAIAQNTSVYVRLNGSSVALCYDAACSRPVTAPAGSNSGSSATKAACSGSTTWYCEAPTGNAGYTTTNSAFYFSPQGKPYNTTDTVPVSTFSQLTVTVTGDGGSHQFFVEMETGYVHH